MISKGGVLVVSVGLFMAVVMAELGYFGDGVWHLPSKLTPAVVLLPALLRQHTSLGEGGNHASAVSHVKDRSMPLNLKEMAALSIPHVQESHIRHSMLDESQSEFSTDKDGTDFENDDYLQQQRRLHGNENKVYGKLSDVWLCLACAVGWTVWIISTLQDDPQTDPFREKSSNLIRGHVLQVTLGQDPDGTGIPVYHAVIDYIVETTEEPIQIRKTFETNQFVEEGFFNVELLVLEEDPTMSVLKDEWLMEARQKQLQEPRQAWMRASIIVAALLLIAISFWGAKNAVLRCKTKQQTYGWVSVGAGAFLLGPLSLFLHNAGSMCLRWVGPLAERQGTIIRAARTNLQCGEVDQALEATTSMQMSVLSRDSNDIYINTRGAQATNISTEAATTSSFRQSLGSALWTAHRQPHAAAAAAAEGGSGNAIIPHSSPQNQTSPSLPHNNTFGSQPVFDEQRIFSRAQAQTYFSGASQNWGAANRPGYPDSPLRFNGNSAANAAPANLGRGAIAGEPTTTIPEYNIAVSGNTNSSVSSMSAPGPNIRPLPPKVDSVMERGFRQMSNLVHGRALAVTSNSHGDEDSDITPKT